eukprot:14583069-Heterocapsa_arctica.AAC.1
MRRRASASGLPARANTDASGTLGLVGSLKGMAYAPRKTWRVSVWRPRSCASGSLSHTAAL